MAGENCSKLTGYKAVYRLCLGIVAYHLVLCLLTVCVKSSSYCRGGIHNGWGFWNFATISNIRLIWDILVLHSLVIVNQAWYSSQYWILNCAQKLWINDQTKIVFSSQTKHFNVAGRWVFFIARFEKIRNDSIFIF